MTIHLKTTVKPGGRIEISSPQLSEGEEVTVTVDVATSPTNGKSILDFFRSLPASGRTEQQWQQFDRDFRAERDSWE